MNFADLDLDRSYTYADYLQWHFEERLELIKGRIFKMTPAPSSFHQKVSGNLYGSLWSFLKGKKCDVFSAPFDVRLTRIRDDKEIRTVVQPDLCVVCDPEKIDSKGCLGAPDIVVEILSPGNNQKELNNKYDAYEEAEVKEYWIIHPHEKTFMKYTLNAEGKYIATKLLTLGSEITTPILQASVLKLDDVFENL